MVQKKIGQHLVSRGRITSDQLLRALEHQETHGGRLGTNLLELEIIGEEVLLDSLGEHLNTPTVPVDRLRAVQKEAINLLPKKFAMRGKLFPFDFTETTASVAMINPRDLLLIDEVEFALARKILPHLAIEARLYSALEKHYRIESPRRFTYLCDRLDRARFMWKKKLDTAEKSTESGEIRLASPASDLPDWNLSPSAAQENRTAEAANAEASIKKIDQDVPEPITRVWQEKTEPVYRPERVNLALPPQDKIEKKIRTLGERDAIARLFVEYLSALFDHALLFMIRKTHIQGWIGAGKNLKSGALDSFELSLLQPSLFLNLKEGADFYSGPLPPLPTHRHLASLWGGGLPHRCWTLPIQIGGRVVSALYVDGSVEEDPIRRLQSLVAAFEAGLAYCILVKKQQISS